MSFTLSQSQLYKIKSCQQIYTAYPMGLCPYRTQTFLYTVSELIVLPAVVGQAKQAPPNPTA